MGLDLECCSALQRLNLTPDDLTLINSRVNGITRKKQQRNDDDGNNRVGIEGQKTIERNLAYLEERLDLNAEQLRTVVVGYPQVLSMRLETNLMPTVAFFYDALHVSDGINEGSEQKEHQSRVATLLCESPDLLEYNVAKRLKPRLERVRSSNRLMTDGDGADSNVNEEMLRAIATLTDSRFEAWLLQKETSDNRQNTGDSIGGNVEVWEDTQQHTSSRKANDPSAYVVVSNLQSGGNIGNIVRSASIFGCEECIVVGQRRYRMTGDHGSRLDLPRRHMWSHTDARDYLHGKGVRIYGIEIMENASPIMRYDRETGIMQFPFDNSWSGAAFIFGNEGQGLSAKQREICDEFLFIPQNRGGASDGGGSASMNVACAASVILQAYCMWAGYSDASLEGEKFVAI